MVYNQINKKLMKDIRQTIQHGLKLPMAKKGHDDDLVDADIYRDTNDEESE